MGDAEGGGPGDGTHIWVPELGTLAPSVRDRLVNTDVVAAWAMARSAERVGEIAREQMARNTERSDEALRGWEPQS